MSGLVVDLDRLSTVDDIFQKTKRDSISYRVIAQFIDMEYSLPETLSSKYFCKVLIQNLPGFKLPQVQDSGVLPDNPLLIKGIYMEENIFKEFFINEATKITLQPGDPIDIQIISWNEYDEEGSIIWEALNLGKISVDDVRDLREFILSPQGQDFMNPQPGL